MLECVCVYVYMGSSGEKYFFPGLKSVVKGGAEVHVESLQFDLGKENI